MTRERIIRFVAGSMILVSLALGIWVNHWWFIWTAFVGLNLFQSSLTQWCLLDDILRLAFHVKSDADVAMMGGGRTQNEQAGCCSK